MIWIGNQTAFSAARLTEPFEYAVRHGFDAFEWFPDKRNDGVGWDGTELDKRQRQRLRDTATVQGLRISLHARWQANPLRPEVQPLFLDDLELARDLGAVLLNTHLFDEEGLEAYVAAISPLIPWLDEAGLQLAIENTPRQAPEQFNELFVRLRARLAVPSYRVGMCLDLGHANLCAATRNDYVGFLRRLSPQVPILHVHLHENWGDADSHLPLFTGPAAHDSSGIREMLRWLRQRNFSGSIILEQWPQPPLLLNQARDQLRQWLGASAPIPETRPAPPSSAETSFLSPLGQETVPASPSASVSVIGGFARELIEANQRCRSWREKLEAVRELLVRQSTPLSPEHWVDLAIYLRFLGTGEIPCVEDGRHFRPGHHARIAQQIQEQLAQLTTPETAALARLIYPWLPSSARTFQRAEPLTRIRDLAHRNDIPTDLKREIKQTLQNKLHRCAGPEDLATSTALLARLTAPGAGYSPAFVEQFKVFQEELQEFFNARSLEDRLQALLPALGDEAAESVRKFLATQSGGSMAEQLIAFEGLTELRRHLLEAVRKSPGVETQALLLADIGLEDFAFVLVSDLLNALERTGTQPAETGAPQLAGYHEAHLTAPTWVPNTPTVAAWESWLETGRLVLTNLVLTGIEPEEGRALVSELTTWRRVFDPAVRESWLRLKATLDRCRRLAESCSDRILALFPGRAETMGRAMGVAESAIRIFGEAVIRSHLVFQLSKLVSSLLRWVRQRLGLPPWDVLVSGGALGRLMGAGSLAEVNPDLRKPLVVLLNQAEGDEEIPPSVAGILLAHEIPHLSHLGVRARQAGVVFVACEDSDRFTELARWLGQTVSLVATPEKVNIEPVAGLPQPAGMLETPAAPLVNLAAPPPQITAASLAPEPLWIPLEQAVPERAGSKADGARRLAVLAGRNGAGFNALPGLVIPFGVMEAALAARPEVESEYTRLLNQVNHLSPGEFRAVVERLRGLIQRLQVHGEITAVAADQLGGNGRLIVRSSANCEDLAALAGAGLYESCANVAPAELPAAVRQVWSSLWTRRAALSRKQAGIPHAQAHMAVLIQPLIAPDYSFILHTVNPINQNPREIYIEIAVGLGETLASAAVRGNPYRLVGDKTSGAATLLACASFSQALWPDPGGGLRRATVDYSRIVLSREPEVLSRLGSKLTAIGRTVEQAMQQPQDIEGLVAGSQVYLVQARPQPGLTRRESESSNLDTDGKPQR